MATVNVSNQMCRPFVGNAQVLELEVDTVRALINALERCFPGLGPQVEESMAVAIDGVIVQDTYLERIGPDSEVFLVPKIAGG